LYEFYKETSLIDYDQTVKKMSRYLGINESDVEKDIASTTEAELFGNNESRQETKQETRQEVKQQEVKKAETKAETKILESEPVVNLEDEFDTLTGGTSESSSISDDELNDLLGN
jgi:hypothetical protein